jgi:hypothetical protein
MDWSYTSPFGADSAREILDSASKKFVKRIAMQNGGLCIITSRIMPPELNGAARETGKVRVMKLDPLGREVPAPYPL